MLRPSPKYRTLRLPNDDDVYLLLLDCLVCDVAALYIWGVSRKLATFGKMTVTGVYLRYLNVLLLYYPFMSNPRPCLGCATQQMWSTVLHFFLVAGFVSRT